MNAPERVIERLKGTAFSAVLVKQKSILPNNGAIFYFIDSQDRCHTAETQQEAHTLFKQCNLQAQQPPGTRLNATP